jgi:Flp pilus assembly pilin Flp
MAEYTIILSVIIIGVVAAVTFVGASLTTSVTNTAAFIASLA